MKYGDYQILKDKVIIRLADHICETSDELINSRLFFDILKRDINDLKKRNSRMLNIFGTKDISTADIKRLAETLLYLSKMSWELVVKVVDGSDVFFKDRELLAAFIEHLYNSWRNYKRLVICDSEGNEFNKRPYRTFNRTVETLMHLVRSTYRDVQENITGIHPRIYRQVTAGAEIGAIAQAREIPYEDELYTKLNSVSIIRQTLIYPPLIFSTPNNKRTGVFPRVDSNPLKDITIHKEDWICYPARVGPLTIMIYFANEFFEMGFALSNLFELADNDDLLKKPDAVCLFGVPTEENSGICTQEPVFYDDLQNDILIGTVPLADQFGYFGYLKKMVLTLHNIKMMKKERMPFHGALFKLILKNKGEFTVMVIGDSGAGKSETLEALRIIGDEDLEEIIIVADDMGSIKVDENNGILGFGTEIGAFVRLDDLQPGFAFGQIDRTIIMNPAQVNARVVLPVTTLREVVKGHTIDLVLYANNYEAVDDEHPAIEAFTKLEDALETFRAGKAMSKGTTTSSGLVQNYFANVFGPPQYQDVHEVLAKTHFKACFDKGLFVGQLRTQLGIPGKEQDGPQHAAKELLRVLSNFKS